MNIKWNNYFDHIFVISRCKNFEKRERLESQIKELKLNMNFSYWYNCDSNYIMPIKNLKELDSQSRCTYGHYNLWKTCYELNYDNVLILEDDVCFLKDINEIENQLEIFKESKSDIYSFDWLNYIDTKERGYALMSCYFVNQRALKFLINMHEKYNINNDAYLFGLLINSQNNSYTMHNICLSDKEIIRQIDYIDIPKFNVTQRHLTVQPDYLSLYKEYVQNFDENLYKLY